MRRIRKLTLGATLLSFSVGLVLALTSLSSFGYRVESVVLDSWFTLRYRFFGPKPVDPRLMLVGVDEATIQQFGKPSILWQSELADLIGAIKEQEPAVVGLDIVISPTTHALQPNDDLKLRLQDEAMQLGLQAMDKPPVVLIEVYTDDYIFHGQEDKNQVVSPHELILDLLLDENGDSPNLALANVVGDTDGVLRRGKLFYRLHKGSGEERPANLAFRLLELATGEPVKAERTDGDSTVTWKGKKLPILFHDSFLVNYPGPTENNTLKPHNYQTSTTFPIVSAQAVLNGEVPSDLFEGKIVIVAPTASSLADEKVVPGDPIYHGAAMHLSVINMFFNDLFISRSRFGWVALTLLASVVGLSIGRAGRLLPGLGAAAGLPLVTFLSFSFLNGWLPSIFPLVALTFSAVLGYALRLLTVEKDRARVRSTFARMVSPQVMHHVLANYKNLKNGERKEITVLFVDINDFTPICERHDPEEVIHMLSDYFSLMVDVIMKYDGYLKQYVGDEIMVIYGAPDDSKDHATRALLTALEMRDVLKQAKLDSKGKPGFYEVKIGINTGPVVVGKVGPETRWEYAAVGDNVNLGARVMSAAKNLGMDIGVSQATKERYEQEMEENPDLRDRVKWNSQGVQSFKGKISQMEVFGIERSEEGNNS